MEESEREFIPGEIQEKYLKEKFFFRFIYCYLFYFYYYSFIHMCIHCLGHFSLLPSASTLSSTPSLPGRTGSALFSSSIGE
jgi:hypothetical protein